MASSFSVCWVSLFMEPNKPGNRRPLLVVCRTGCSRDQKKMKVGTNLVRIFLFSIFLVKLQF